MQLRHLQTLHLPSELNEGRFPRITSLAVTPSLLQTASAATPPFRLAVSSTDKYINLYDEEGVQRDKFPTKPADKDKFAVGGGGGAKSYTVRAIAFSPCATKVAVGQSDNILFVYKIGIAWGDKKTICNKYAVPSSVTCLTWPVARPNEIIFGCADGKIRVGNSSNKCLILYSTDSPVLSISNSPDAQSFVTAHMDGKIYHYTFSQYENVTSSHLTTISFTPSLIGYTNSHIIIAGNCSIIRIIDLHGNQTQQIDTKEPYDFTSLSVHPSNTSIVLGTYNKFLLYSYSTSTNLWEYTSMQEIPNLYSITALLWKNDGSRLYTGSLCGSIDSFNACYKRVIYKQEYEFIYTSPTALIIHKYSNNTRTNINSQYHSPILNIAIKQNKFILGRTAETLILGNLNTGKYSEIVWQHSILYDNNDQNNNGTKKKYREKFLFLNEFACLIYVNGEITIIEYGINEYIGSIRTEYSTPNLLSLVIYNAAGTAESVKKIAYLLDKQTIKIINLNQHNLHNQYNAVYSPMDCNIMSTYPIINIELNYKGNKCIYRDNYHNLHYYDIFTGANTIICKNVNYLQFLPLSDVIIAASNSNKLLNIWYSPDNSAVPVLYNINGPVLSVIRSANKSEIVINDSLRGRTCIYLDEASISFSSAIDRGDYYLALNILENINNYDINNTNGNSTTLTGTGTNVPALWNQLAYMCLNSGEYFLAERCYAALGDMSKVRYLHDINAIIEYNGNKNHYMVEVLIAVLYGNFNRAELTLLQNGQIQDCIYMYKSLFKYQDAIRISDYNNIDSAQLKTEYFDYLIRTNQEVLAGTLKEKEGNFELALNLYLKGGNPIKAANLIINQNLMHNQELCQGVINALINAKHYEKLGDFYSELSDYKKSLEYYLKGNIYTRALEIARQNFPAQIVKLEEGWGDYLVSQYSYDAACNHYIQCGNSRKALDSAIEAKQWVKAAQIYEQMDHNTSKPYARKLAVHAVETNDYIEAEKYYLAANCAAEAVKMYILQGMLDKAHKLAVTYMSEDDIAELYISTGQLYESRGELHEAEQLYLTVNEVERAITMYKNHKQFDEQLRLMSQYKKGEVTDTHITLGQTLETEGNYKGAEAHYIAAGNWNAAYNMYKENNSWDDAIRIAKTHGGATAYKQVAYEYATTVGGEAGMKGLIKRGLGEMAVDVAMERNEFTSAFAIAEKTCKSKLPAIHLQYAMALEDEGKFTQAEDEFILAKKPREAIDMYIHQREWESATRVATAHDSGALIDIVEAQAKVKAGEKAFMEAEEILINGGRAETAVKMYMENQMWDDALRLAKVHVPRLVAQINQRHHTHTAATATSDSADYFISQAKLQASKHQWSNAIDLYLKVKKDMLPADQLVIIYETAVTMCMEHAKSRAPEIIPLVAKRLIEINHYDIAANMYLSIRSYQACIDTYLTAGQYEKAKSIAATHAPTLLAYVSSKHSSALLASNNLSSLASISPDLAIDAYAANNDWDKVYELATKQGEPTLHKYASLHAATQVKANKYRSAVRIFLQHGIPIIPANFPLYKRIATEILAVAGECEHDTGNDFQSGYSVQYSDHAYNVLMELKDMLYKLLNELNSIDPTGSSSTIELQKLLLITHHMVVLHLAHQHQLSNISTRTSISLLRYTTILPVDKCFYDAGMECKAVPNLLNYSFICFNRYIDLTDLMVDPDSGDIDNKDFIMTDIPTPFDVPLPANQFYSEQLREEIREWVLEKAMSHEINQTLNTRRCNKCNNQTYEGALTCHACHFQSESCIVTGWPIEKSRRIACKNCQKGANLEDWNKFVAKMKVCPWCKAAQSPVY